MKPIKLEFVAFGPYKDRQVIDFEKIGNGIFAITGPTGAGKTTIFDALMYALFGEVSSKKADGDANSVRNQNMMRCQFADSSVKTEVRLEFEENGKRYMVKRTFHFRKDGKIEHESELSGDGEAFKGLTNVNNKITELLGDMNATRFRQIVMLAQGQFRAFMESKDEQRKEILGKLFDSTPYKLFQERLGRVKKSLEMKQADQDQRLRLALLPNVFILPDGADARRYSADLPPQELENNLRALIASDDDIDAKMSADVAALNKIIAELNEAFGAATIMNNRYGEMVQAKERLANLEAEEMRWATAKQAAEETARALHDVKPAGDEVAKLRGEGMRLEAQQQSLHGDHRRAEGDLRVARADAAESTKLKKQVQDIADDIIRMESHFRVFDDLDAAVTGQRKAKAEIAAAEGRIELEKAKKARAEQRLTQIDTDLAALATAETDAVKAEKAYADAKAFFEKLAGRDGLIQKTRKLCTDQLELEQAVRTAQAKQTAAEQAIATYNDLYRRYIAGYAGKLGLALEAELREKGKASCPVCGCEYCADTEHDFAHAADIVTDEALHSAEVAKANAEEASNAAMNDLSGKNAAFENSVDALLRDLAATLPDLAPWVWDETTPSRLDMAKTEAMAQANALFDEWQQKQQDVKTKQSLQQEQETCIKMRDAAVDEINKAQIALTEATRNAENSDANIARCRETIATAGMADYADKAAAQEAVKNKRRDKKLLDDTIAKFEERLQEAEKNCAKLAARLEQLQKQIDDNTAKLTDAESKLAAAMAAAKFDEATYRAAIARCGDMDGEAWLDDQRKAVNAYRNDLKNTREQVEKFEKENLAPVDVDALEAARGEKADELQALNDSLNQHKRRAETHRTALETLNDVSAELTVIKSAYMRMKNLSDVANGASQSGGRRTFDGYVLGTAFRDMLEHATDYLIDMTGGKYALIHDTEGVNVNMRTQANFRIRVQDNLTEEPREIGSLSGGESFQAAMALALGLSDAVQSHHSTVHIDTMFIDEGFGSLDKDSLHNMMRVLTNLAGDKRQIGIISHVEDTRESLGKFIHVTGSVDNNGSSLRLEV